MNVDCDCGGRRRQLDLPGQTPRFVPVRAKKSGPLWAAFWAAETRLIVWFEQAQIGVSSGVAFRRRPRFSLERTPRHHGRVGGRRGFARALGWFDFGHQVVDPAWRAGTAAGWSVFINAFHNTLRVTAAFTHLQPNSYCRGIPETHWRRSGSTGPVQPVFARFAWGAAGMCQSSPPRGARVDDRYASLLNDCCE